MNYNQFLEQVGMNDREVIEMMNMLPDPEPEEDSLVYPIISDIQGIGLASYNRIGEGEKVLTLLENGVRKVGARYTNHASAPNTKAFIDGKNMVAIATRPIKAKEEITICYNDNVVTSREYTKLFLNKIK